MKYKGLRRGKIAKKTINGLHSMWGRVRKERIYLFTLDKKGISCYAVTINVYFSKDAPVYYEISTT